MVISIQNVCNFVLLCAPSKLESEEVLEANSLYPFTHYMICTINRLRIKPNSIFVEDDLTKFVIMEQIDDFNWKEHPFYFAAIHNNELATMASNGKEVHLTLESGKKESFENVFLFLSMIAQGNEEIHQYIENLLKLNVQYIGQTEISKKYLRFKGHEKKNKLSDTIIENQPEKEVIIKLLHFQKPFTSAMLIPEIKSDDSRMDWLPNGDILSNMPFDEWKTLVEGTLIKYFMPIYNKHYRENFPSEEHSTYRYFYDQNVRSVLVELHEEYMAHKTGNDFVPYTRIRLIEYAIQDDGEGVFLHNNDDQTLDEFIKFLNV